MQHQQFSGTRLKALRKQAGLSRTDLAYACRVTRWTVAEYEQGRYTPSVSVLETMALACACSVADFFEAGSWGIDE